MNVDLGIWENLRRFVLILLFLAAVAAVCLWYVPLVRTNERLRQQLMAKNLQIRQEEERGRQLDGAIRALRTDPRALERLAREKLGYIKPGETRIQFDPPAGSRGMAGH